MRQVQAGVRQSGRSLTYGIARFETEDVTSWEPTLSRQSRFPGRHVRWMRCRGLPGPWSQRFKGEKVYLYRIRNQAL